jgi:hypothetical protein
MMFHGLIRLEITTGTFLLCKHYDRAGNVIAQIEYGKIDSRWILPDFFYKRVVDLGSLGKATYLMIDTRKSYNRY